MRIKKGILLGFLMLALLVTTILASYGGNNVRLQKAMDSFSNLIEKGTLDKLSLTIYYMDPITLTRAPLSVDDLMNFSSVKKIVIHDINLEQHMDLFKQITNAELKPVKNKSRIDARIYYFFETEESGNIFDVAMWGDHESVFVNGLEVERNEVFLNVVMPFLSEDALKDLEAYMGREG